MFFFAPRLEAQFDLVEEGGTFAPNNLATAPGATPIASDVTLDGGLAASSTVTRVAWSRDNTGLFTDRTFGEYTLQYTTAANPSAATPAEDWNTIGNIVYDEAFPDNPALRHLWEFEAVSAVTAIRVVVPQTGIGGGTNMDEIEVYGGSPELIRGNCNSDDKIDISDAVCILKFLFSTSVVAGGCKAALNVNGDATVDISDPVALLNFLFVGGASAPAPPFPECGPGMLPADDKLGCDEPPKTCQ